MRSESQPAMSVVFAACNVRRLRSSILPASAAATGVLFLSVTSAVSIAPVSLALLLRSERGCCRCHRRTELRNRRGRHSRRQPETAMPVAPPNNLRGHSDRRRRMSRRVARDDGIVARRTCANRGLRTPACPRPGARARLTCSLCDHHRSVGALDDPARHAAEPLGPDRHSAGFVDASGSAGFTLRRALAGSRSGLARRDRACRASRGCSLGDARRS
jgi:hypothetical protein